MPRLILKSPYIKPGGGAGDYLWYIATREGVDFIPQARRDLPATRKQQQLIRRVLADFPDCATLAEHEDYQSSPTIGNASAFLHVAMEADLAAMDHAETYLKYIATRRGAERQGAHGLFGDERPPSLEAVAQQAARHTGNVWTHIISLRREDAARLGFDSADAWRSLLLSKRNDIADLMKIPPDDFRWFAAYHDAGHHPHVHMAVWSADPRRGFLTEKGLKSIRALLAKELFHQDLISIYARKTRYRDESVRVSRDRMAELASALGRGVHDAPELERDVLDLAERLERSSGKKQYGYLSLRLKELVDRIADQLGALPQVSAALDHWWEMQCEVYRTYHDETPDRCRSVYMYLKDRANIKGECWPAISTLCRDLQLSRRTVQRALRELEADGFLSTARRATVRTAPTPHPSTRSCGRRSAKRPPPPPRGRSALLLTPRGRHCDAP